MPTDNEILRQRLQLQKEFEELIEREKTIITEIKAEVGETDKLLELSLSKRRRLLLETQNQVKKLEKEKNLLENNIESLEERKEQEEGITKEEEEQLELQKQKLEVFEEKIRNNSVFLEQQKKITNELKQQKDKASANEKGIRGFSSILTGFTKTSGRATEAINKMGGGLLKQIAPTLEFSNSAKGVALNSAMMSGNLMKVASTMGPWGIAIGAGVATLGAFLELIIATTLEFDKQRSALNRTYGSAEEVVGAFNQINHELTRFGVTSEVAKEITDALASGMRDFRFVSDETQFSLGETVAQMRMFGVSASTSAKFLQETTKALQMTADEAMRAENEMVSFALEARLMPQQVVQSFAAMMPRLAMYGDQADEVFKEMTLGAANLGLETQQLFSITEGFQTFESAAQTAAKLNAVLGGGMVNSLELLTASYEDPMEAIELLREAFQSANVDFENLNAAQRRMFADIVAQGDVSLAAKLLGSEEDFRQAQASLEAAMLEQEKIEEQRQNALSVMEQFGLVLEEIKKAFGGEDGFENFANTMKDIAETARVFATHTRDAINFIKDNQATIRTIFGVGGAPFTGGTSLFALPDWDDLKAELGFAKGTDNFSGGMALVGEKGPEMVALPPASSVITNQNTQKIMKSLTTNTNNEQNTTNNINNDSGERKIVIQIGDEVIGEMVANVLTDQLKLNVPYVG